MENFFVATVSNTVNGNHIAWSSKVSEHTSLEDAQFAARELHLSLIESAEIADRYMRETVIVHDGEVCY